MIVAIPVDAKIQGAKLSAKFARSPFFAIINTENKSFQFQNNAFLNDQEGVGKNVVSNLVNNYHVDTLIGFELGFKVQQLASELGLQQIILNDQHSSLKDLLIKMKIK